MKHMTEVYVEFKVATPDGKAQRKSSYNLGLGDNMIVGLVFVIYLWFV